MNVGVVTVLDRGRSTGGQLRDVDAVGAGRQRLVGHDVRGGATGAGQGDVLIHEPRRRDGVAAGAVGAVEVTGFGVLRQGGHVVGVTAQTLACLGGVVTAGDRHRDEVLEIGPTRVALDVGGLLADRFDHPAGFAQTLVAVGELAGTGDLGALLVDALVEAGDTGVGLLDVLGERPELAVFDVGQVLVARGLGHVQDRLTLANQGFALFGSFFTLRHETLEELLHEGFSFHLFWLRWTGLIHRPEVRPECHGDLARPIRRPVPGRSDRCEAFPLKC